MAPQEADAIESFWRSLRFFSIYRLSIALMFLVAALVFGDTVSLGTQDPGLFDRVAAVYVLLAVAFLVALLRRPRRFSLQLSVQVAADIAALTLMMFASGGQKSGIAILLLVGVAVAVAVPFGEEVGSAELEELVTPLAVAGRWRVVTRPATVTGSSGLQAARSSTVITPIADSRRRNRASGWRPSVSPMAA